MDFPGSVDSETQTQLPRPRPFYCADYYDPFTQNFQVVDDGFAFFAFPESITITPDTLHTLEWEWGLED